MIVDRDNPPNLHCKAAGDINGNGRPDIIVGGRRYENPGDILEGTWAVHLYMPGDHSKITAARGKWSQRMIELSAWFSEQHQSLARRAFPSIGKQCRKLVVAETRANATEGEDESHDE